MNNNKKIILDLCGGTGAWSKPYKNCGYKVINITLPEYDVMNTFLSGDYLKFYRKEKRATKVFCNKVHGVLCAPPCTQFSKADWRTNKKDKDFREGMEVVIACLNIVWTIQRKGAQLKFWALENPMGYLYNFLGKPAFYFQPWQFGEIDFRATKRTALWGYFNQPGTCVRKRKIPFIRKYSDNKGSLAWGSRKAEDRAKTSECFAKAFFKANK